MLAVMRPWEEGLRWGKNFGSTLLQPARSVSVSLSAFFHLQCSAFYSLLPCITVPINYTATFSLSDCLCVCTIIIINLKKEYYWDAAVTFLLQEYIATSQSHMMPNTRLKLQPV